jgi:hypothetical protein
MVSRAGSFLPLTMFWGLVPFGAGPHLPIRPRNDIAADDGFRGTLVPLDRLAMDLIV